MVHVIIPQQFCDACNAMPVKIPVYKLGINLYKKPSGMPFICTARKIP
jgi:hypothetical protein